MKSSADFLSEQFLMFSAGFMFCLDWANNNGTVLQFVYIVRLATFENIVMRWNCCKMRSRSLYVFRQHDFDTPGCVVVWKTYPPHPVARDWVTIHHISVPLKSHPPWIYAHIMTHMHSHIWPAELWRRLAKTFHMQPRTMKDHESRITETKMTRRQWHPVLFPLTFNCDSGIQTIYIALLITPVCFL